MGEKLHHKYKKNAVHQIWHTASFSFGKKIISVLAILDEGYTWTGEIEKKSTLIIEQFFTKKIRASFWYTDFLH